ncbi:MAG: Membrane protein insertase, YidC/Oxa1 family [Candidatus Magasanikbacteria bacterium GW2011_GWA2_46_17]|uniref:Membrane protein insertase, YidC/Oxa1 family n=1 Tax=Candidatus Magasanikbacteria bacterium GW2011_GWA2_46_17 TaxID=1619042 RepID=A0A0G1RB75_9BACT|nr:MAG: Membrane protein insertase, YidC/Oxa1 family [Candidatus Magasanikbacteria bacterium GW2011_GWA2_46_17]HBF67194.1 hypothetical protein [Candidatus Magasanikbacteria bacterium]
MFTDLFNTILYNPILNALIGIYNVIPWHDFGLSVVIITLLIKIILYPLTASSLKSQKALQDLQPKMQELKEKHKGNQQAIAQETMKLYKANNVNPLSSCLPLLVQLPILLALYWALRDGIATVDPARLYSFIEYPGEINPLAFGFLQLSAPSYVLAVLAGLAQYAQARMLSHKKGPHVPGAKDENMMAMMNKQMLYVMPVVTVLIGASLPAALTLYWFISTVLTWLQQILLWKKQGKPGVSQVS